MKWLIRLFSGWGKRKERQGERCELCSNIVPFNELTPDMGRLTAICKEHKPNSFFGG